MFKYLQIFPFIDRNKYLYKEFQEDNLDTAGWIRNSKNILKLYGEGNLIQNIFNIIEGEVIENDYKPKHEFFQKRASNCYLQRIFHSYIDSTGNKSFVSELKQVYKK